MGGIGGPSLILIIIVALFLFGPNKLPEMGKVAGKTLREFKSATKGLTDHHSEEKKENKDYDR
ncbi:twin-arginine translocase TatA/TatE family subunit [Natribacillus halophilus]|uniref:Sec-independent protein translocase protein TatA n=1 Tax=Natribacillus halophilus TaxID=549003 RepID=A0A1G8PI90_9BACI|nr:twin-arginine translocase TatA/TatE family subunit [Natribacillus halophilus]SDI91540.1 sec-independent protein translocase protein TatA [Natribacillus halophilus]